MRTVKKPPQTLTDAQLEIVVALFLHSKDNSERAIMQKTGFTKDNVTKTLNAYLNSKLIK